MSESTDVLLEALCRAAFQPQLTTGYDPNTNQQGVIYSPSPLLGALAGMLQKAFSEDAHLRQVVLAELTKPETIKKLVGEIAQGIGKMRVNASSSWNPRVETPDWVREALTASLIEWLGTEEAAGLVPQMLERGTIKITVERTDANGK